MENIKNIQSVFRDLYHKKAALYRSPGRINLIGEHTDYNEGFVLPAAIDKEMKAAIQQNGEDTRCRLYAIDLDEHFEFDLDDMAPVELGWPNYIMGVADQMIKRGLPVKGFDCIIGGDIPLGSGLSSSAALECVIAFALNDLFKLGLGKLDMIKISQLAEHSYAGVMCGIMDQFASMMGKKDQVFKLDCKSLDFEYYPLDLGGYQILLINSNVKHSLASTEYNTRRQECETGVSILKEVYPEINSLRDVSIEMLINNQNKFDEVTFKRCKYVIEENDRVLQSCDALQSGDLITFGQLVYASHHGLSREYEVSCEELDFLVDQTKDKEYILGARMMGGGFGGCTLNIIKKEMMAAFIEETAVKYEAAYSKKITPIEVSIRDGSSAIA